MSDLESKPDNNKMAVEKIEGGLIQVRKGFAELEAEDLGQTDAVDAMNRALYKLEQKFSDVRKVFYGE